MQSYIYNGKKKIYETPKYKRGEKPLFDNLGFIICGSYPTNGFKTNGSKLLHEYNGSPLLDYYLDLINLVCEKPEVIIVSGVSTKELIKHPRKSEYIIVENQMYEFSNTAEDLRIGLLALRSPNVIYLDSGFLPTIKTLKYLLGHKDRTTKAFIKDVKDENYVGVNIGNNGHIANYSFKTENTLAGMYYINPNDIGRIRKRTINKNFSKNLFTFELLSELKVKAILDESDSVIITR
jgi:hypothetical protein